MLIFLIITSDGLARTRLLHHSATSLYLSAEFHIRQSESTINRRARIANAQTGVASCSTCSSLHQGQNKKTCCSAPGRAAQQSYATGMQAPPAGEPPERDTCVLLEGMHEKISLHCECKAVRFRCASPACTLTSLRRSVVSSPLPYFHSSVPGALRSLHLQRLSLLQERLAAQSASAAEQRRSAAPFDFPSSELPPQSRPL